MNVLDSLKIYRDPYGVVLILGAWNYPVQLTLMPLIGAIAGGNCVIIKPSEIAPASAKVMKSLVEKYLDTVRIFYICCSYSGQLAALTDGSRDLSRSAITS